MISKILIIFFIFQSSLVFPLEDKQLVWQYLEGVTKAQGYLALKQERPLFNIDSSNSFIEVACRPEWKCVPNGSWEEKGKFKPNVRVKMVTLASSAGNIYKEYMGNIRKYPLQGRIIWVTAFPELKNFCKNIKDKNQLKLSLEKFLGLPADTSKEVVITLWVKPDDLFRPCFSPDITSTSCPIEYPPGVSQDHKNWLNETISKSFFKDGKGFAYPFTRMGYTYSWGNPHSYQGSSEYIVKPNAKILVDSIDTIERYCTN